jgi:hypothetical protein
MRSWLSSPGPLQGLAIAGVSEGKVSPPQRRATPRSGEDELVPLHLHADRTAV